MFYRAIVQPLWFMLSAETAHRFVMRVMRCMAWLPFGRAHLRSFYGRPDPALQVQLFGRTLVSPIGLGAGLDKDADAFEAFGALGFGCVEVGTLTAQPQPGNPRPRLFRLKKDRALINRMGFNNRGAEAAARSLATTRRDGTVLGINIGKSKVVPAEQAVEDYVRSATLLGPYADYLVINVSSPNTPGLRDLQNVETLRPILVAVRRALDACSPERRVPLLVKIAPACASSASLSRSAARLLFRVLRVPRGPSAMRPLNSCGLVDPSPTAPSGVGDSTTRRFLTTTSSGPRTWRNRDHSSAVLHHGGHRWPRSGHRR